MPFAIVSLVLALAGPAAPRDADAVEAGRLYTLGERAMDQGEPTRAVPLWREAIVALPQTAAYDRLRHRLVLRLGYGLMAAWERSGDRRYLVDAQQLLERYVARHEAIFGDDARARAERGQVYEQLYEVERRLAPPVASDDDDASTSTSATKGERGPDARGLKRVVRVKTRRWHPPTHDDARVHAWIAGPQTSTETGLMMTAPTLQPLDPPRAYVRLAGPIGGDDDGGLADRGRGRRALARAALLAVRPALRACFSDAFARSPHDVVRTSVRLEIGDDGRIRAADVVGEDVIDAAGSACVEQQLATVALDPGFHGHDTLELPLVFFWKDATNLDEGNGVIVRDSWDTYMRPRTVNHGSLTFLPAVESFTPH